MKYYSIRVVEADNLEEAVAKIESQDFDETDPICDKVLTLNELVSKVDFTEMGYVLRDWEDVAGNYLCDGDENLRSQVNRIAEWPDGSDMIDNVDGVFVWEKVVNKFTCDEFLHLIGYAG